MELAQAKPRRKRRRSLIVTVVLLALVVRWFWPRGDARFVGKCAAGVRLIREQKVYAPPIRPYGVISRGFPHPRY